MKKPSSVRWTIILMAVAMMALIAFQYHWIQRDMRLAALNFERNVRYALRNVLDSYLEHQITSKRHIVINTNTVDFSADSLRAFYFQHSSSKTAHQFPHIKVKTKYNYATSYDERDGTSSGNISVIIEDVNMEEDSTNKTVYTKVIERIGANTNEEVTRTVDIRGGNDGGQKSWKLNHVTAETPTLDFQFLQEKVQKELTHQGLVLAYEFGIMDTTTKELLFQNEAATFNQEITKETFQFPLIGYSAGQNSTMMLVHFPSKNEFLLKNLSTVLIASLALVAIVATCFWFAIRTILRQKRLSVIKNDFINNMTHEFKTPISNVSLAIEALQNFGMMAKPETTQKYLDIAKNENTRLGKQVEKVLQMALLDKEEFQLKIKPISLHNIVEEVISSFKLQVEQKGGIIHSELMAANDLLEADELHLTNVLFNLVDNANKYSPEQPDITIQTENTKCRAGREGISILRRTALTSRAKAACRSSSLPKTLY